MWERGQVHRAQIVCQLAPKDAGIGLLCLSGSNSSTYEGCPICLKCLVKKNHLQQTTEEVDTKRCSEKEKARPQWMATPQHVHLQGRDNETVLFSIHNVPCTTDSHVQWLVQTPYGSKGTKRVGWRWGAYIALLHLLLDLQLGN